MKTILLLLISISSMAQCPLQGTAKNKNEATANILKNRTIIEGSVDTSITLQKILAFGKDSGRFSTDSYVKITGYLVEIKKGGPESCNCELDADSLTDTHIYIGSTPHAEKPDCIIVEITPKFKKLNKNIILKSMKDKQVNVYGFLFYDSEHKGDASNTCNVCKKNIWRRTVTEIHPVCKIEIVQ